jgi:hypothetical protein
VILYVLMYRARHSDSPGFVCVAALSPHYPMLQRNLLYTGVARGKRDGRPGRAGEGGCHCGARRLAPATVVEARRVAALYDALAIQ